MLIDSPVVGSAVYQCPFGVGDGTDLEKFSDVGGWVGGWVGGSPKIAEGGGGNLTPPPPSITTQWPAPYTLLCR